MRRIYRYYGMCGTFKATTIQALLQNDPCRGYTLPVWSLPKPWKRLEQGILKGEIEEKNNLTLAALELCTLEGVLMTAALDPDIEFILAERGVLDNLFYWSISKNHTQEELRTMIEKVRGEEERIEESYGWKEVRNTILVMEDEEFIDSVILSEPSRREWFPDVKSYLEAQEKYVKFMFKWLEGKLAEHRIINARDYIENKLKLKYNA